MINDFNREITTFFRVLQRHYVAFLEMMRFQITTRAEFDRLVQTAPETLTDLERAARFLYLQRTSFGGDPRHGSFGVSPTQPARFDLTKLVPMLEDLHVRLTGVVIECQPWIDFIARYDRPGTLFYLDPPYWGNENDYGKGMFARKDFEAMAAVLAELDGSFILSLNDRPEVRETFAAFKIQAVKTTYSAGTKRKGRKPAGEVIISSGRLGNG